MPATLIIENDALTPINTVNFGSVSGGGNQQIRMLLTNTGTVTATSVVLALTRITINDGVDYTLLAPDVSGAPGTFSQNPLTPGTLAAGAQYWFWVKVVVPVGASPQGNPRNFNIAVTYAGT
jgi:hypothetical protein